MKTVISFSLLSVLSLGVYAQDQYFQKLTTRQEIVSDSLSAIYTSKLALTQNQQLLFKQKLGAFLIRKQNLKKELTGRKKLDVLYKLGQEENAEMREVLTDEQYSLYVKLKSSIQPLDSIK